MRTKAIVLVMVCLVVGAGVLLTPSANAGKAHPQWLYLVYLDADNSLDVSTGPRHHSVVQDDLDELMSVGSTAGVAAYVLVDRIAGPAHLFYVEEGSLKEMTAFALDGKEADMGDPATLRAFVAFTQAAAPADHTVLTFWDHGSPEYVAYDEHDGAGGTDYLTHQEVIAALDGFRVDVVAADECLVAEIEVAYEYVARGLDASYLVAAETYTGWRGYPYDATLGAMVADPAMTPREVAVMFVEETDALLSQSPYMGEEVNSHSAIDLGRVTALATSVSALADLLAADMGRYASLVSKARGGAQFSYGANAADLMDLRTFVGRIASGAADLAVRTAAGQVLADFDDTVIALQVTQTMDHQIAGLGIAFPTHSWETPSYYGDFAFPSLGWMGFLEAYWATSGSI